MQLVELSHSDDFSEASDTTTARTIESFSTINHGDLVRIRNLERKKRLGQELG